MVKQRGRERAQIVGGLESKVDSPKSPHNFLTMERLAKMETRCQVLQQLIDIDVKALISEIRAYKECIQGASIPEQIDFLGNINEVTEINWAQYPMTIRPKHIQQIMKMSQKKTYEFFAEAPFHVAKAGRELYVSKEVFRNWLEGSNEA